MQGLEEVGEIAAGYRHVTKVIHSSPAIEAAGGLLKWYDIAERDKPVPRAISALARESLDDLAAGQSLAGELGFVILHRCGESFYFLLVSTWRNENELWESVWAKSDDDEPGFQPWPPADGHHPTFCVWELRVVCQEQAAWTRYLRSARNADARKEWVKDTYTGLA
jgi:hypothetical protein